MRTVYLREFMRGQLATAEGREKHRARADRYRHANPERIKARNAVSNALRDGRLERQPCEVCGSRAEAHHLDYARLLDVKWLCKRHHERKHHKADPPFLVNADGDDVRAERDQPGQDHAG